MKEGLGVNFIFQNSLGNYLLPKLSNLRIERSIEVLILTFLHVLSYLPEKLFES
jgi:hypothetical protein